MEFFKKIFTNKSKSYKQDIEDEQLEDLSSMQMDEVFVYKYKKNGGKFFYPENIDEFTKELLKLLKYLRKDKYAVVEKSYAIFLEKLKVPVTTDFNENSVLLGGCEYLIADEGAIMTTSKQTSEYRNTSLPKTRILVAMSNQIIQSKSDALSAINRKYDVYPSNIQTMSVFSKDINNAFASIWYDVYLFLIEN